MIKPQRMSKVLVVGPKSRMGKVVAKLHELQVAHIIEHKKDEFDLCSPLQSLEKVSSLLVQVRSLLSALQISNEAAVRKNFKLQEVEKQISPIKRDVSGIIEERKKLEDAQAEIVEQKKILGNLALLKVNPESFRKSSYVVSYVGSVAVANVSQLKEKLAKITDKFELITVEQKKVALLALFADSTVAAEIGKVLAEASFTEMDVSAVRSLSGEPSGLTEQLSKKEQKLTPQLVEKNTKWKELAEKYGVFLAEVEKFLSTEAEKGQAPLSFGSTREAFFVRCYVPSSDVDSVNAELSKAAGGAIHIAEEELGEEEETPIKLRNPKALKSFEFFTNLYSLPKYNEFDPTMLMAFTFPLFFGFMLGDVGYGLITLLFFYALRRKVPAGKDFFNILMVSSVSAILFGFLYGEVFGYEPWHGIIIRTEDTTTLMIISGIAGLIQVNFGLILGFILERRHHGFMHALNAKVGWMVLQVAAFVLYRLFAIYHNFFSVGMVPGWALLGVAFFMLYKGEGLMFLPETLSLFSHIVSYARLMAVGLASVFIAVMVNDLTTFLWHKGAFWVPLAIVALVIGHTFNIALGILSPSLHSIRLHYVEFFTKFYKGGGKEYVPFGAEKQKSLL